MNAIREIQNLNKRELENVVSIEASWHNDYRDTAYIYIGGLDFKLTEGDILTIFSQFGEPTYLNLIREKETGKSKGFAFMKYEDQRSTDLAVDNLGGATLMGKVLKVDHTRYKRKEGEEEEERARELRDAVVEMESEAESEEEQRPMLREEVELAKLIRDHDDDDPMKEYLVREKRDEVAAALTVAKREGKGSDGKRRDRPHKHHHHRHHHHHHHSRRERQDRGEDKDRRRDDGRRQQRSRSP